MCPNEQCEHHGKSTGLLGGCDCGTALVTYCDPSEPTNEQLGRLVSLFSTTTPGVEPVSAEVTANILDREPQLRAAWIERHREFQAALRGEAVK